MAAGSLSSVGTLGRSPWEPWSITSSKVTASHRNASPSESKFAAGGLAGERLSKGNRSELIFLCQQVSPGREGFRVSTWSRVAGPCAPLRPKPHLPSWGDREHGSFFVLIIFLKWCLAAISACKLAHSQVQLLQTARRGRLLLHLLVSVLSEEAGARAHSSLVTFVESRDDST